MELFDTLFLSNKFYQIDKDFDSSRKGCKKAIVGRLMQYLKPVDQKHLWKYVGTVQVFLSEGGTIIR